jgi:hypothetical protein
VSFVTEKPVGAVRKRHLCSACDKWIEIGEPAVNWAGTTDGDFSSVHYHPDCREAEIAFNRHAQTDRYADEWQGLLDAEPEDRPWIKANWPLPYLRMCMTRKQYAAHRAATTPEKQP